MSDDIDLRKMQDDLVNGLLKSIAQGHSKTKVEWGGTMRCQTSDGPVVNMADELNRLEKEKND